MRGWVCSFQLLLVLSSAFILGSEPSGTHDCIFLSQIVDSPNLEGQVPVFISFRHWVPFSSSLTSCRSVVVLDPPQHGVLQLFLLTYHAQKTLLQTVPMLLREYPFPRVFTESFLTHGYFFLLCIYEFRPPCHNVILTCITGLLSAKILENTVF
jgi:hypothetical protein